MTAETDLEKACMETALRPLGEVMAEMGLHKKLSDLTRDNALTIIEVVVNAYGLEKGKRRSDQLNDDIPF